MLHVPCSKLAFYLLAYLQPASVSLLIKYRFPQTLKYKHIKLWDQIDTCLLFFLSIQAKHYCIFWTIIIMKSNMWNTSCDNLSNMCLYFIYICMLPVICIQLADKSKGYSSYIFHTDWQFWVMLWITMEFSLAICTYDPKIIFWLNVTLNLIYFAISKEVLKL